MHLFITLHIGDNSSVINLAFLEVLYQIENRRELQEKIHKMKAEGKFSLNLIEVKQKSSLKQHKWPLYELWYFDENTIFQV